MTRWLPPDSILEDEIVPSCSEQSEDMDAFLACVAEAVEQRAPEFPGDAIEGLARAYAQYSETLDAAEASLRDGFNELPEVDLEGEPIPDPDFHREGFPSVRADGKGGTPPSPPGFLPVPRSPLGPFPRAQRATGS